MNPVQMMRNPAPGIRIRRFFWMHPEWWSLVLVAVAWGMIVSHAGGQGEHVHHNISFSGELRNWGLMVVAMMVPLILESLRWIAFQNFHHRRHRAILFFLLGYLVPWMTLGAFVAWLRTYDWSHNPLLAPATFAFAALWALVRVRHRALVFCHLRVPLASSNWKADRDCLRFGLVIGASCVITCAFLMLACSLTGHNLVAMVAGTSLGVLERRSFRPPTFRIAVGTLLLATWFLLPILTAMHL